jgi:hypothetical protein
LNGAMAIITAGGSAAAGAPRAREQVRPGAGGDERDAATARRAAPGATRAPAAAPIRPRARAARRGHVSGAERVGELRDRREAVGGDLGHRAHDGVLHRPRHGAAHDGDGGTGSSMCAP